MLTDTKADKDQPSNLTHFQMLIWTGQLLDPDAPLYNNATQILIPCSVDASAFRGAFGQIVSRSQTMRTVFETVNGMPQPHIWQDLEFELPLLDFSQHDAPRMAARDWCRERSRQKLQLDERLFDSALLKLADDEYSWYICQHHLICDAWSTTELFRRQAELYHLMVEGRADDWQPPSESQPGNQRTGDAKAGSASPLSPTIFYGQRPLQVQSISQRVPVVGSGDRLCQTLAELGASEAARSFSKEMSLFQVVLTLLYAYSFRASGQRQLCVGVPFHNRLTPEAKQTLGVFIEFYPTAIEIDVGESFRSLLKKVQTATTEYLRAAMAGLKTAGTNARFNTVLNFVHAKFGSFGDTSVEPEWLHTGYSDRQHHLRLHAQDIAGGGQMELHADFNCDVFDETQTSRAVAHLRRLIDAMAEDWDQTIASVDILVPEERTRQLDSFNATPPAEREPSVVQRLSETIARYPDETALLCEGLSLTYEELDLRINELVARMAAHEITPGNRLVICLERSPEAVVAILAALRAGMTFVPLDPTWPAVRQEYVLEHCQAAGVVTTSDVAVSVPAGVARINVDAEFPAERSPSVTQPNPHDTAYILYTSGSTGRPKGVEITHGALANYVNWAANFYAAGQRLAFPLFTHLTFDLTMTSVFVPLVTGGRIIVFPRSRRSADVALLDVIADDRADIIKLTPSHLSLLTDRSLKNARVRQLIVGGEDLKLDLAKKVLRTFPQGTLVHNEYGPTEATVGCIVHTYRAERDERGPSVPIGKPIAGMQAYVLNEALQLVPDGVTGELHVSGAGLAKGYLGQPELTAERFLEHPFYPGARIYKTGDLARFKPDGVLEYLGRQDHQVKIRGARVELGAIESTLAEHPQIAQAVVTTYGSQSNGLELEYCRRCGLPSNYPDVEFDEHGICNQCRDFDSYRQQAEEYFNSMDDLQEIFNARLEAQSNGAAARQYDCLVLLSGGKDSTYMLARLADMGLRILAFTLDNGYISDQAKANIRRVVQALGVDHHFGSTPAMNQIFVDSLRRHANVCQGCFKTIYTLSMNLALEKNIPFIATGLSRGQFFETRLTADLFKEPCDSLIQIDQTVLDARKAYHRVDDAVFHTLDVAELQKDHIFEQVQFIDFYRYCDVSLDEMLQYLDQRLPWVRPADTGRSTNCLINDVGIYVHQRRQGYHNYALPYSWDVRLGHKQRDAALEELNDDIDVNQVHRILQEVGYDGDLGEAAAAQRLAAYYVSPESISTDDLNDHLKARLPSYMVPSRYIRLDELPLTANGKVDLQALPDPLTKSVIASRYVAPSTETESMLAGIWSDVLRVPKIGTSDNFFDLGGDSIMAIQIVARANRAGIRITPSQLFDQLTICDLASAWDSQPKSPEPSIEQRLTPFQHWLLEHDPSSSDYWNQSVEIRLPNGTAEGALLNIVRESLVTVTNAHAALRTQVSPANANIRQLSELGVDDLPFRVVNLSGPPERRRKQAEAAAADLHHSMILGGDQLLGAILYHCDNCECRLLFVASQFAVDAISWQIVIDDFKQVFQASVRGEIAARNNSESFARWSAAVVKHDPFEQIEHWRSILDTSKSPLAGRYSGVSDESDGSSIKVDSSLDVDTTRRLAGEIPGSRVTIDELLIGALAKTLGDWSKQLALRILVARNGRDEPCDEFEISRTVGCFTILTPVKFSLPEEDSSAAIVKAIKGQLRSIPASGISYGMLRYLSPQKAVRDSLSLSAGEEVVFNFLGKFEPASANEQPFTVSRTLQLHRSPSIRQWSALDITAWLEDRLCVRWECRQSKTHLKQIKRLADDYLKNIRALVTYCLDQGMSEAAASDFPLAQLDDDQLKQLAALLNRGNSN